MLTLSIQYLPLKQSDMYSWNLIPQPTVTYLCCASLTLHGSKLCVSSILESARAYTCFVTYSSTSHESVGAWWLTAQAQSLHPVMKGEKVTCSPIPRSTRYWWWLWQRKGAVGSGAKATVCRRAQFKKNLSLCPQWLKWQILFRKMDDMDVVCKLLEKTFCLLCSNKPKNDYVLNHSKMQCLKDWRGGYIAKLSSID